MKLSDPVSDMIRRRQTKFQLKRRTIGGLIDENTLRWPTIGPLMVGIIIQEWTIGRA